MIGKGESSVVRIQVDGCIMGIRHFSAFCIDDDASSALMLWNAVSASSKVEDLRQKYPLVNSSSQGGGGNLGR